MMYLLAIFLPPVAVLMTGRPIQAVINFGLTLLLWVPGAVHAILVVNESKADKRMERQVKMQHEMNLKEQQRQMRQDDREQGYR